MPQLMDLKVDYAFKQLFGSRGNERILIAFLNAVLDLPKGQKIRSIQIENPELIPNHVKDKKSILDIYAVTEEGVHVNIEIQMTNKHDMKERTLYYWGRIYTDQMNEGEAYSDLSQTITINILNFRFLRETSAFHTSYHLYEDEEKFRLTDIMELHFIEIPKLLIQWRNQLLDPWQDLLARWLLLLGAVNREEVEEDILKELEKIAEEGDPVMKEAIKKWEDLSRDTKVKAEYLSHLKAVIDEWAEVREAEKRYQAAKKKGLEQGREEGREEERLSTARNLLDMGMDIASITRATGLSGEKIKKLKSLS